MTPKDFNNVLIEAIKEKLPPKVNLANLLMDILFLGKEAIYRRLRGEVPFTLTEAAAVSKKLGVSLDKLVGTNSHGNAMFELDLIKDDDPTETYYTLMKEYADTIIQMKDHPESEIYTSCNLVPHAFYLKYEHLSRFRLFKWTYRNQRTDENKRFDKLVMPEKLLEEQNRFVHGLREFSRTCYIWDNLMFEYLVNDIRYFVDSDLIRPEEVELLKEELHQLLNELEQIANKGRFSSGKEVQIYISNINFEATYTYVKAGPLFHSIMRVFAINSITSQDPEVFESTRDWIQSLKKFSTLISESNERQRIQFFKRQRQIVNSL